VKAPGLIALLGGKSSMSEDEEDPVESAPAGGVGEEFAREAFAALKDDDEEGFVSAFLSAVRSASKKKPAAAETDFEDDDSDY
jgi:hypothetical protein